MNRSRIAVVLTALWSTGIHPVVFPAGTTIPIRFLTAVTSGRDTLGTPVTVQTFGALVSDSCIIVPAFTHLMGRIVRSVGGRRLGRSGELGIRFDSLEIRPDVWATSSAVLDTLEFEKRDESLDSGIVQARSSSVPVPATGARIIPSALIGRFIRAHRGLHPTILAGEMGVVRLLVPLVLPAPAACIPVAAQRELHELPELPRFAPHVVDKRGDRTGDAINLIFLGTGRSLDSAFRRAQWVEATPPSFWALTREVTAAIAARPAIGSPVSTLYFEGRKEDLAYELSGPNARIRHHVRIWMLDSLAGVWVGAATKDIGVRVNPLHRVATHRIDPDIDSERDLIALTLESGGCANLLDYLRLPGADTVGHTVDGQHFFTDARSAVIRLHSCAAG